MVWANRTLYDVVHSSLKKVHTSVVTMTEDDVKVQPVETHKYLFTTSTCPNCRMAKKMLEGEELEIIDRTVEACRAGETLLIFPEGTREKERDSSALCRRLPW